MCSIDYSIETTRTFSFRAKRLSPRAGELDDEGGEDDVPADVVVGSNAAERALMTVDPSARCDSPRCVGKDRRDADVRHHANGRGSDHWMIMREAMLIAGAVESRLLRPMKIHMIVHERM